MNREIRRPTIAEIDLGALAHNYRLIRSMLPERIKIMAVVKADAYHHGAIEVARTLEACGVDYLAVALVEEGMILRKGGISAPIMLLSGAYGLDPYHLLKYHLQPVVFDLDTLVSLNARADKPIAVHLKIDTGMGRLGFLTREIPLLLEILKSLDKIRIAGILTHFSSADEDDPEPTKQQMHQFNQVLGKFRRAGIAPALVHAANSAASLTMKESYYNMVRVGLALYGIPPKQPTKKSNHALNELKPVMRLKTSIIQIKTVPAGTSISYSRTYKTSRPSRIATLPIGYADGFDIRLSNNGEVLVHGKRAPVVGRVCMDLTMIDCTEIPEASTGDEVVVLGNQGEDTISAWEIAQRIGSIPYEVLTSVSVRVHRVFLPDEECSSTLHN